MNKRISIQSASYLLAAGFMLSGCETLGPKQSAKLPLPPVTKIQGEEKPVVLFDQLHNKPTAGSQHSKVELYPGNDRLQGGSRGGGAVEKNSGKGEYSLNFDDADLGEVAKVILSDILGKNYIISPKVAGKVTLQTTEPLGKNELLPTLERVLRINGAALVKVGDIYHIQPAAEAVFNSDVSSRVSSGQAGQQTRVIPIRYVSVTELVDVIKPLVQEKTIVNVDKTNNSIIASGTGDEIDRVLDLVDTFDIDVMRGRSFGLFPLMHVSPENIIKELEEIFITAQGKEGGGFFRFLPIERLNAVLAITHQSRYLSDIEHWVLRLDRTSTTSGGGVNVYRVQNMDAVELADTLNAIFNGTQKQSKAAKVAPGQTASTLTNKPATTTSSKTTSKRSSTAAGGGGQTGDAHVSNVGEVRIIADQANNSIVTVSTPQEYEIILPVIQQLDVMPLQVLIDATIVSVKLTDELIYGIEWFLNKGRSGIGNSPSTDLVNVGDAGKTAALAAMTGGLSMIYSSGSVQALLSAQAKLGNVNVISSPSLMVLNNQEAKINVGDQVPLQTSTTSVPIAGGGTSSATLAQSASINYQDTGVTLEVTPRVNANGMVIMDIKQIVSNVVPQPTDGDLSVGVTSTATINKKQIESFVAVQDSETIVLGGLIDETVSNNKTGIPFLNELPWIGPLFGTTDRKDNKNELVVLITPRVVKSKQDSRIISDEFKRKLTGIYEPVSFEYQKADGVKRK